ncbi:MAG: coproporphyrinogen-III oxidase family protein, partial [Lachnospiraceae bacterium]|nr:coproporphyrinogen-III oxidase family protein [Lachnospiraceae bacterium]
EAVLEFAEESLNRISLGVQSANDDELEILGRIHTFREAEESVRLLREAGIRNLNVDLMSAIPGQTEDSFRRSLEAVLALEPEHISVYSLILEEGTPFYTEYAENAHPSGPALPDEEAERRMYYETRRILGEAGYGRYEISNYARPGYASAHNIRYWKRSDYLGFGIGASSLFEETRWTNQPDLRTYLETDRDFSACVTELEKLDLRSAMEEFMFLGLRMTEGVSEDAFRKMFGRELGGVYGETLQKHIAAGLLVHEEDRFFLTERGMDVSNTVMADYLF